MTRWLRGIGITAIALIAIEIAAAVGITLLGPDAFRTVLAFYKVSGSSRTAITNSTGAGTQRCTTYNGELFCIPTDTPVSSSGQPEPRCAVHRGTPICITEES